MNPLPDLQIVTFCHIDTHLKENITGKVEALLYPLPLPFSSLPVLTPRLAIYHPHALFVLLLSTSLIIRMYKISSTFP